MICTPNIGCSVLGVHIITASCLFFISQKTVESEFYLYHIFRGSNFYCIKLHFVINVGIITFCYRWYIQYTGFTLWFSTICFIYFGKHHTNFFQKSLFVILLDSFAIFLFFENAKIKYLFIMIIILFLYCKKLTKILKET